MNPVLVSLFLSKALYHDSSSPTRSTNRYRQELGSNLRWTGIMPRRNRNILKPDINTGLVSHIGSGQTLLVWTNTIFCSKELQKLSCMLLNDTYWFIKMVSNRISQRAYGIIQNEKVLMLVFTECKD